MSAANTSPAEISPAETCQVNAPARAATPRHDWARAEIRALFALPLPELIFRAQSIHRENFDPNAVQISTLLSVKTGGCPEDCAYCPQSARYETGISAGKLLPLEAVLTEARAARSAGATRFCMGAAWRSPKERDVEQLCTMIEGVKALGMETCATLGMLTSTQARKLKAAGLPSSIKRSSPREPMRIVWKRSDTCVPPASMSAAAALSAWAKPVRTASV